MTVRSGPLVVVRQALKAYADRGAFKKLSEAALPGGKHSFTFLWLTPRPVELLCDTRKGTLELPGLLPNVPARGALYSDIRRLLAERHDGEVPSHRRIDRRRAEVACVNTRGSVSIALAVKKNQYAYGLNRLVNLVHDLFFHLRASYDDYMCESFGARRE